ncbi:MAG: tripartite tricarboxylate transporter TctB family protein [Desulfofustis sp.]|nr:tripartite tricarboxylate transporter TctB family protein [Desulfofustis sp.]
MLKALLKADVIISAIVFFAAVYLYIDIKAMDSGDVYGQLGPAYWPKFVLVSIMVLSVGVAFFSIKGVVQEEIPAAKGLHFTAANARFIAAVSLIAGYLILLPYVGFLVLTPFQMMIFMYLLGERKKIWIFTIPFVLTIGIVLIFTKAMYVPLPRGVGIFLEISHLLY